MIQIPLRWAAMVSGEGTNLQVALDAEKEWKTQSLDLVVADRPCRALERAKNAKKSTLLVSQKSEDFQKKVLDAFKSHQITAVFLLGYQRILPDEFLRLCPPLIVNLHPSLLPHYKGQNALRRAFDEGENQFGISIHRVVAEVDAGDVLQQITFERQEGEAFESLYQRSRELEHQLVRTFFFDLEKNEA
jgi:phosphoribosylglycinamide formyltransferase-1